MKRGLVLLPVVGLLGVAGLMALRLADTTPPAAAQQQTARPVPAFTAAPLLPSVPGFSSADLKGQFILVNVFASWCAPCLIEHPRLMTLSQEIPVYGIAFGDKAAAVDTLLKDKGNPFSRINDDPNGSQSIGWGVRGVPESFLVDPEGRIVWSFAGPITATQQADIEHLIRGR
jgi:cytochrome c biogenesis protein CcmG/thiol:disulfide interchange protein DsbE